MGEIEKPAVADETLAVSDPSKDVVVDLLPDHLVLVPQQDQLWRLSIHHKGVWLTKLLDTRYRGLTKLLTTKW